MKFFLSILMVGGLVAAAMSLPAEELPKGGPFVNEKDFPKGGNPKFYYWIDLVPKAAADSLTSIRRIWLCANGFPKDLKS